MNLLELIQNLCTLTKGCDQPVRTRRARMPQTTFRGHCVPEFTGPISLLHGRKLAVIADVENLSFSAQNAGYKFSYATLADLLRQNCQSTALHACFTRQPHHKNWERYFEQRGWTPHARDIAFSEKRNRVQKHANADALIAFQCGRLAAETNADILIATGDGALAMDVANSIAEIWPDRLIFTLAFPGAASSSLGATNRSPIAGNLLAGLDMLHPRHR